MKEINLLQLIDMRNQTEDKLNTLLSTAEKEIRKLTDEENSEFEKLSNELRELNNQIKNKEEIKPIIMENFSLLKTINNVVNKRTQSEAVQELINLGKEELRKAGQTANGDVVIPMELREDPVVDTTIVAASGAAIAKETANLVTALKSNLVLLKAGANYMGGLTGNVGIPTYSGTNVAWADETGAAADGAGTLSEVVLKPKRLTAYVDVSKQFLMQESADAERILRDDIAMAISAKLEATILGAGAGSDTQPAGLLYGVSAAPLNAVKVDEDLDTLNVQNKVYILSPKAKSSYRAVAVPEGVSAVYQNGEIFGSPTYVTSAVAENAFVAGDFSDLIIAQWGGLDITVDPYSQATNGKVRLIVNAYFDAAKRRNTISGYLIGEVVETPEEE